MIDTTKIKKDFPILNTLISNKRIVYLDSTASSLKPLAVIEKIEEYYKNYGVNIFRGLYKLSEKATLEYENVRVSVARFIGAKSKNEIIFVRNATEAINMVASSFGEENLMPGDEILLTVMEHHANLVPWQQLAQRKQAKIKYGDILDSGVLNEVDFLSRISKKTKIIGLTFFSNVLGCINPVQKLIRLAKEINPQVKVLIDAAQAIPHMKLDVSELGADFLVFSAHKMLGPTGVGVLWGKYELLDGMFPYQSGGDMIKEVTLSGSTFKSPPHKFEAGTPNIAGVIGLGAAVEYLSKLDMDEVCRHEQKLTKYALEKMNAITDIDIYGPREAKDRGGIISFNLRNIHAHDVAQILDNDNICVRAGHHCAMPLHDRLNISSSARASFYIYNDESDIDFLIVSLQKVLQTFGK